MFPTLDIGFNIGSFLEKDGMFQKLDVKFLIKPKSKLTSDIGSESETSHVSTPEPYVWSDTLCRTT
jgi:hypothetical protein